MFVGCKDDVVSPLEFKFQNIIEDYDATYSKRIKSLESEVLVADPDEVDRNTSSEILEPSLIRVYKVEEDTYGFIVASMGYEEEILIFTLLDGEEIKKIDILYEKESEDYGEYVTKRWFLDRLLRPYEGPLVTVRNMKDKDNEVIAITGATITSEAVVEAVNQCIDVMASLDE